MDDDVETDRKNTISKIDVAVIILGIKLIDDSIVYIISYVSIMITAAAAATVSAFAY